MTVVVRHAVMSVAEVGRVGDDRWNLRGRVYEDLRVDEVLHVRGRDADGIEQDLACVITTFVTYRHELPFLSAGMTGDVFVAAPTGTVLTPDGHAYR